jgi:hypothetical protein
MRNLMIENVKSLVLLSLATIWFVLSGLLIAEKTELKVWLATLFIYAFGLQWVYCYVLGKNMYTAYAAYRLEAAGDKHSILRLWHFLIGLTLCVAASIF